MLDTDLTYNGHCPECGHSSQWPLLRASDGSPWFNCFTCGNQQPSQAPNDLDPAHHQCPTCTVRTAVEHAHSDPRGALVLEVWHEQGCPTAAAARLAADDPWAHPPSTPLTEEEEQHA